MTKADDYRAKAKDDAVRCVDNFSEQIAEQLQSSGKASDYLRNDYSDGDSYHHENHVGKDYDLQEAAALLDQLSDDEETDSGLWLGLSLREAISAQAAYTYGNAVYREWTEIIEQINDDFADSELADKGPTIEQVREWLESELKELA